MSLSPHLGQPLVRYPKGFEDLADAEEIYAKRFGGCKVVKWADGVVIKYGGQMQEHAEEVISMNFARRQGLLVPKVFHYPGSAKRKTVFFSWLPYIQELQDNKLWCPWYICMEEVKGIPLSRAIESHKLSDCDLSSIGHQLKHTMDRLARLRRPDNTIGSVTGGPLRNLLFSAVYHPHHTFESVTEFLQFHHRLLLKCGMRPEHADELIGRFPLYDNVCFTHGDLVAKNVMVDQDPGSGLWHITAVLDWANSGYYPAFWDYCRMHEPNFMTPEWSKIMDVVYPGPRRQKEIDAVCEILDALANWLPPPS